uniref:ATP synthase subunit delta n=1 Tax=Candidatus Aschnera chinzeii TaxID=1485666 RepID=A0AAT9G460_9ENTR|nr:MAG: F0F1 ATP synthase subunit delta [Candidatus Aschnera chinzeii]
MLYKNKITTSRYYAKAAFEFAYRNHVVDQWEKMLHIANKILLHKELINIKCYLRSEIILANILINICNNSFDKYFINFILLLGSNNKIDNLTIILKQFIFFKNNINSIINVHVVSAVKLNIQQKNKLIMKMEKIFLNKIQLTHEVDKSIIGGIVIYVDDRVIDKSIRNQIRCLNNFLQF